MAVNINEKNTKVSEGVWEEFDDCKFLIASTNSPAFQRMMTKLNAPHRRKIEKGTLDPDTSRKLLCKAMSVGLLLDWKGVTDGKNEVPFSAEAAEMVLSNNDLLREFVQEVSFDLENFRMEDKEKLGKG